MNEAAALFPGRHCTFVVCSDGELEEDAFSDGGKDVHFSHNSGIVDMVVLSMCDYIIGPPSTFCGYASFMGNAPKHIMLDKDTKIQSLSQFGVYMIECMDDRLDENGNKILTRLHEGKEIL